MIEAKLQSEIIKWLKSRGAYVIKNRAGPGVPVGCPDIVFFYKANWGVIEVKASEKSRYRPAQADTILKLSLWSPFVYRADPVTWSMIKAELVALFF